MAGITTHVLNTALGKPAERVPVILERREAGGEWAEISRDSTNADGRVASPLVEGAVLRPGLYRLTFDVGAYFSSVGSPAHFYPYIPVVFNVTDSSGHYHVPLLLSPFGYSTYRGS